jgi:nicotinate-nucleotide pyrophosphorylase (carboxylating)
MPCDFSQIDWDDRCATQCRQLVRLAIQEDLDQQYDWTTLVMVPAHDVRGALIVARQPGVVAGLPAAAVVLDEYDPHLRLTPLAAEGAAIAAGTPIAEVSGPARSLLTSERVVLNVLGRLCGIATLTSRFVAAVAGTGAAIYDTRKTLPGWRRLEKYAVRCGGGCNHRMGLYDAILIKDNHLALAGGEAGSPAVSPAAAVRQAREFVAGIEPRWQRAEWIIEVEVDTLQQLHDVLPARPDLVLLDNMPPAQLRTAVEMRDRLAPDVVLEASGGITLDTVAEVARTGVDRISVGALTHSAAWFDVSLEWPTGAAAGTVE